MFSICLLVSVQRFYPLFHWRESLRTLILDQYSFLVSFFLHPISHLFHFSRNDKVFSLLSNGMNWAKQEELLSPFFVKRFCNLLKECRATNSSVKMEQLILVRPIKLDSLLERCSQTFQSDRKKWTYWHFTCQRNFPNFWQNLKLSKFPSKLKCDVFLYKLRPEAVNVSYTPYFVFQENVRK